MKKYARVIILATLPVAYILAIVINVINCKPANLTEVAGALLIAPLLAIELTPIVWVAVLLATALLAVPAIILAKHYKRDSPQRKRKRKQPNIVNQANASPPP